MQHQCLTNALLEDWSKILVNTLLNLAESLPKRVENYLGGPANTLDNLVCVYKLIKLELQCKSPLVILLAILDLIDLIVNQVK